MPTPVTQQAQRMAEGLTYGGGLVWLSANSSAITAAVVLVTGIASIYFGKETRKVAMRNAKANEERNRISKISVFDEATEGMEEGESYTLEEIRVKFK